MEAPSQRCKFWLPRKNRFCANPPVNHSLFCGNHNPKLEQMLPCPLDPSHNVLKENVEAHIKRCPFLRHAETLRSQPFYKKGINGGTNEEGKQENLSLEKTGSIGYFDNGSSGITTAHMKKNAVYNMTSSEFLRLLNKIKLIHASVCSDLQDSYKIPEACSMWMKREVDGKLPFQEKHVLQQASVLGNLEEFGVLPSSASGAFSTQHLKEQSDCNESSRYADGIPAVIEFGAGRGYLTQMLADCYGTEKVFLVERKSYRLKADRSLRKKERLILERLRIDIEDLDLNGVESLKGVPYVAVGKHLCGPATDLTLRCCLGEHCSQDKAVVDHLRGLAIATCCHHLCQWKHYINRSYLHDLGITKDDFHAMTRFTSWAVDADHSTDRVDQSSRVDSMEMKGCGGAEGILREIPAAERAVVGFMCKDIIDMGRLMWIMEHGLEARFVKYVPPNISPENHLLLAKCSNQP